MPFDFESLKDILVCPKTRSPLVSDETGIVCTDSNCRLRFDIRDGIPVMLVDEATELSRDDWAAVMRKSAKAPLPSGTGLGTSQLQTEE